MSVATRRFVPEVVQTSAMDCGPAALKSLLAGFGIAVSYGRLREACQTSVDGTSIDVLEDMAVQLGLEAEQVMVPLDHLFLPETRALPALMVVRLPSGVTHFIVVWRRHGRFVQLMDPSTGRRWTTTARLLSEAYVHTMPVPAEAFREWGASEEFAGALRSRLRELRIDAEQAARWLASANADASWRTYASVDAAARMTAALVRAGGVARGGEATRLVGATIDSARREGDPTTVIPAEFWTARPAPRDDEGGERVFLRGVVLVRGLGRAEMAGERGPLPAELVAALEEKPERPARELWRMLRADGALAPGIVVAALALAAFAVTVEAVVLRGLLDLGTSLSVSAQRLGAVAALGAFLLAMILFELPMAGALLRIGRHLETRLRTAFLTKIPRLHDRYFHSRLTSDMADRCHGIHSIRRLPVLVAAGLRAILLLLITTAGIAWLDPSSAPLAMLAATASVAVPLIALPVLTERDLRARTHAGALSRFSFDALVGLVPLRCHVAERAMRREHEGLLVAWAEASLGLQRAVVAAEAAMLLSGYGLSAWLIIGFLHRGGELGALLLLVYWALALPVYGRELALAARQYPGERNRVLRLLEPLGAPEDAFEAAIDGNTTANGAASIALDEVSVVAGGHTILDGVSLDIAPGSHVAIVGRSGAGKSSLVGLLLGWHRPSGGRVLVDGRPLDAAHLDVLRNETVWLEPGVQLFNRSLFDNLCYGATAAGNLPFSDVLEAADLASVIERLPDGLQTELGDSGGLLSGGEGQRVRLGRALMRRDARLVILDEPFRALDRPRRRELLARVRSWWKDATILCITHDVEHTRDFDRVLVVEAGRVIEDGSPPALQAQTHGRYRALLAADRDVHACLWGAQGWRRLLLEDGRLTERSNTAEQSKEAS